MSQSESKAAKPNWDKEVYPYALNKIKYSISRYAGKYASHIKDEMQQYASIEAWKAYERLDAEQGTWKSFISQRCAGAIKDYIKLGYAYEENKWAAKFRDSDNDNEARPPAHAIRSRATTVESDHEKKSQFNSDVEDIAGVNGIYHELDERDERQINFDLLSRLATMDDRILLLAKWLIGELITDMSDKSDVSRERFSQKLRELFEDFDNPENIGNKFYDQVLYALGISHIYGAPEHDNGIGWDQEPVDIYDENLYFDGRKYSPQIQMFGESPRVQFRDIFNDLDDDAKYQVSSQVKAASEINQEQMNLF